MIFLYPHFLWAFLLLGVPIIIHLFNFRRYKKVVFSNLSMLKEIETQSRKVKQVKKWLILLTRMAALASLILAFAHPFLPENRATFTQNLVSIYVDNSESMRLDGENGPLFEDAKNQAREILRNVPKNTEIQVVDNALSYFSSKTHTVSNALKLIDALEIDAHPNQLSQVIQKIKSTTETGAFGTNHSFLFSDFQKQEPTGLFPLDSSYHIHVFPSQPNDQPNVSVDSVWMAKPISRPNEPINIIARIRNHGIKDIVSTTLSLTVEGVQQLIKSIRIPGKGYKDIDLSFSANQGSWVSGKVSVTDHPVTFDNTYFFALPIQSSIKVLQLGRNNQALASIFQEDSTFVYTHKSSNQLDYSTIGSFDFIILNQPSFLSTGLLEQLRLFVIEGGVLSVIPGTNNELYADLFNTLDLPQYGKLTIKDIEVSPKSIERTFFKKVFKEVPKQTYLPKIHALYDIHMRTNGEWLARLKDGSVVLSKTPQGKGVVFQSTVPLDSNPGYVSSELFVLNHLKMAFSKTDIPSIATEISSLKPVYVPINMEGLIKLSKPNWEVILESETYESNSRFWLNEAEIDPGIYDLKSTNDQLLAKVALNQSRKESHQTYATTQDMSLMFGSSLETLPQKGGDALSDATKHLQEGKHFWKLFVLLCLIFLLIEILLLRFIKS